MPLEAEWSRTGQVANASGKVGQLAAFMQTAMLHDECSLTLKAGLLIVSLVMRIDPVDDLAAIANDLSDHVAFEWVGFAERVMPSGFGFVLQRTPI
jgi:hypothetical protein